MSIHAVALPGFYLTVALPVLAVALPTLAVATPLGFLRVYPRGRLTKIKSRGSLWIKVFAAIYYRF